MKHLLKHFDLIMFAVCVLAFLASEQLGAPWLLGLGLIALGLTGAVGGLQSMLRGEHTELIDGESSEEITYRGFSARLLGFNLFVPGLLGLALGLLVSLELAIGPWLGAHWPSLLGVGGLWLAARGGLLMMGCEEARERSFWRRLLTGLPLIGFVLCAAGLVVAACAFGGINPLRYLP